MTCAYMHLVYIFTSTPLRIVAAALLKSFSNLRFHHTPRSFNIVTFTEQQIEFRDDLVPATPKNLEDSPLFTSSAFDEWTSAS